MSTIACLLGVAQDGGRPQAGCRLDCCIPIRGNSLERRHPASLGVKTPDGRLHLFDVSRCLVDQLEIWTESIGEEVEITDIWLTHAHLGHVDGLGLLGREVMGASGLRLHCSPKLLDLIHRTPAWNALIEQGVLVPDVFGLDEDRYSIEPVEVPHRAELSDMHAFIIRGEERSLLHLPDHDSWQQTLDAHESDNIRELLRKLSCDVALLDGTFWSGEEIAHRDLEKIPHPFVEESLAMLGSRQADDPEVYFIHLNHTNPLFRSESEERSILERMGWSLGEEGSIFHL